MSSDKNEALLERIIKLEQGLCAQYKETIHARINACKFEQQLEATQAELAAERAKPTGGMAWAIEDKDAPGFFWVSVAGSTLLFASRSDAERHMKELDINGWRVIPYPLGPAAAELKAAIERAEKAEAEVAEWVKAAMHKDPDLCRTPSMLKARTEEMLDAIDRLNADLAAERAKPSGGVAWALKYKASGMLCEPTLHGPFLYGTYHAANASRALEAKEEAEAEVAKWKEAANPLKLAAIRTPDELAERLKSLMQESESAKAELAALKAAPPATEMQESESAKAELAALKAAPPATEPPPLDKWRVLATAGKIARELWKSTESGSPLECACAAISQSVTAVLKVHKNSSAEPYKLKD